MRLTNLSHLFYVTRFVRVQVLPSNELSNGILSMCFVFFFNSYLELISVLVEKKKPQLKKDYVR